MLFLRLGLALLGFILFALAVILLICYFRMFRSPRRKADPDAIEIPEGEIYEEFREDMIAWTKSIRSLPRRDVSIRSHDGLTLRGYYYECRKGGPIEILFHGYKGYSERDLSGGVERCFKMGRNALLVDHRGSGRSDGHTITFGILEKRDCLGWIDFVLREFGPDCEIILTGVSMGAATVMMAAGEDLPKNVVCVLADCGYTSPKEIICKVITDMKLPPRLVYPFARLSGRILGGFDLDSNSPMKALSHSRVPVILIHGDADDFVPCDMSRRLYEVCTSPHKKLTLIPGAGHGLAFPKNRELYWASLREFEAEWRQG